MIVLCMIVKNEEKTIVDTLRSFLPHVDAAMVVDTGSTDDTYRLALNELRDRDNVGGWGGFRLCQDEWQDFSTNRNRILESASLVWGNREFCWLFMVDADSRLGGGPELRAFLEDRTKRTQHSYQVRVQVSTTVLPQHRIFRSDSDWRYVGVAHEVPVSRAGYKPGEIVPRVGISYMGTDRVDKPKQWRWMVDVFTAELAKNVNDSRSRFYRGQSLELLGEHPQAISDYLWRWGATRTPDPHPDERWEAGLRAAELVFDRGSWTDEEHPQEILEELVRLKPWRAEAWYSLARVYDHLGEKHKAYTCALFAYRLQVPTHDLFFVKPEFYGPTHRVTVLLAILALHVDRGDYAQYLFSRFAHSESPWTEAEMMAFKQQEHACHESQQP